MSPVRRFAAAVAATLLLIGVVVVARQDRRPQAASPSGRQWYVSPGGVAHTDGTIDRPLGLAAAITDPRIRPGDTVWLRGGVYAGSFESILKGTEEAPIVVRQYPGERAILDGASGATNVLTVDGMWTTYWGFEVTNSRPPRTIATPGSAPADGPRTGVFVNGPHTKFVNMIVHDTGQGFGFWADGAELGGSIIYNNGWDAPDRGHGHGIYAENATSLKVIRDNIVFNQFSHGIHAWGDTAQQHVDNMLIQGNVSFNNGALSKGGFVRNILVGGGRIPASNVVVDSNYTYYTTDRREGDNSLGFTAGCINATATRNYFAGGSPLLVFRCQGATIEQNTLDGPIDATVLHDYPRNNFRSARPTGTSVFVRPNPYEALRATIVIYNWDLKNTVSVDLSSAGFPLGYAYEIVDVQNYFGTPIRTGYYDRVPVELPMTGLTRGPIAGAVTVAPAHTAPEFGVFIVRPRTAIPRPRP